MYEANISHINWYEKLYTSLIELGHQCKLLYIVYTSIHTYYNNIVYRICIGIYPVTIGYIY